MDKLISDCAREEMTNRVKDILRALYISSWYSELYHQNQNFSENRYASIKIAANRELKVSGDPANTWLIALDHVCILLNHPASNAIGWKSPLQVSTGQKLDISKILHFAYYEPAYYQVYSYSFP
jgi:hypothetical protein